MGGSPRQRRGAWRRGGLEACSSAARSRAKDRPLWNHEAGAESLRPRRSRSPLRSMYTYGGRQASGSGPSRVWKVVHRLSMNLRTGCLLRPSPHTLQSFPGQSRTKKYRFWTTLPWLGSRGGVETPTLGAGRGDPLGPYLRNRSTICLASVFRSPRCRSRIASRMAGSSVWYS